MASLSYEHGLAVWMLAIIILAGIVLYAYDNELLGALHLLAIRRYSVA